MNDLLRRVARDILSDPAPQFDAMSIGNLAARMRTVASTMRNLADNFDDSEAHAEVESVVKDCEAWLAAHDLDKRMRAALTRAADGINATCDLLNTGFGATEEDMVDMRECARECAALAKEGL